MVKIKIEKNHFRVLVVINLICIEGYRIWIVNNINNYYHLANTRYKCKIVIYKII